MNSKEIQSCRAKPGKYHKHEVLSQEMLELAAVFWECLLRIFSHRSQKTKLQWIESVLSSWPHQLPFTTSVIESKLTPFLSYYRNRAKNKDFVRAFLDKFGEDQLAHFRQVVLQFRSSSALRGQFFFLYF